MLLRPQPYIPIYLFIPNYHPKKSITPERIPNATSSKPNHPPQPPRSGDRRRTRRKIRAGGSLGYAPASGKKRRRLTWRATCAWASARPGSTSGSHWPGAPGRMVRARVYKPAAFPLYYFSRGDADDDPPPHPPPAFRPATSFFRGALSRRRIDGFGTRRGSRRLAAAARQGGG